MANRRPKLRIIAPSASAEEAAAGEIIVLFATGLGKTSLKLPDGEVPKAAAPIAAVADLKVTTGGVAVPADRILYAGFTPGCAGLYQINFVVPDGTGRDPEIRVAVGGQSSAAGLKLAVH